MPDVQPVEVEVPFQETTVIHQFEIRYVLIFAMTLTMTCSTTSRSICSILSHCISIYCTLGMFFTVA